MAGSNYKDLEVWQLGRTLVASVYRLTADFPTSEQFGLTSQLRRAAVSIPANITEGHGRRTNGAFVQFVRVALGSLNEVETLTILASDLGFLAHEQLEDLEIETRRLAIKLQNLISSVASKGVREQIAEYGFNTSDLEQPADHVPTT